MILVKFYAVVQEKCPKLYDKYSAVAEMGDRGHKRHGPKRGGAVVPLSQGEAGFPSNIMWPGPSLPPCHVSFWSMQPPGNNTPTLQTDRQDRQTDNDVICLLYTSDAADE